MKRLFFLVLIFNFTINAVASCQDLVGYIIYGEEAFDLLGDKVSLSDDGNIMAISAPTLSLDRQGFVRILEWDGSSWNNRGDDILDGNLANRIRFPIALSKEGNRVAFASDFMDDFQYQGFGRVYEFQNGSWNQIGQTLSEDELVATFEIRTLSMNEAGTRVAIGRPDVQEPIRQAGSVKVWELQEDKWVQLGQEIRGNKVMDRLGYSIQLSGDGNKLAVSFDQAGDQPGGVRILEYSGNEWIQMGEDMMGEPGEINFGKRIKYAPDGSQIVICSDGDDSGSGSISVFELINEKWIRKGNIMNGTYDNEHLGHTISISRDGNTLLASSKGAVRIFVYRNKKWRAVDAGFIRQSFDLLSSTAISGTGSRIVIGNADYSEVDMQIGSVQVYDYDIENIGGVLAQEIDIFPNPVVDDLNILIKPEGISNVMVRDINGRRIIEKTNISSLNVSDLPSGIYFLEVTVNEESKIFKFIKS